MAEWQNSRQQNWKASMQVYEITMYCYSNNIQFAALSDLNGKGIHVNLYPS
jgi:hypothetical protein